MFEQLKGVLSTKYNSELAKFEELKIKIEELEVKMKNDESEQEYQQELADLNKKYGLFKRKSKEYKLEFTNLRNKYGQKLKEFEIIYNEYIDLKNQAAKINIYVIQKNLERLNNANSLEDLKMTEEEAAKQIEAASMESI